MSNTEKSDKKKLGRIRIATILLSLVAIAAVLLSVYAFMQKRAADEQARVAKKNINEALEQQKIALEQRNIADSSKEQALQQRELALQSEKQALLQRKIADAETRKAEQSRLEALKQQYLAEQQKIYAEQQTKIAATNAAEAKKQEGEATLQRSIASDQKQISGRLKELADSRKMAKEAVLMINEHYYDSSKSKALQAYMINKINDGPEQNSDIYDALNINWVKRINNKNQFNFHGLPVHAVCGIPGSDIIFTADESGVLYETVIKNSSPQRIASYAIKEEVRALAVSAHGNMLVALTALGNGRLFKVSSSGISFVADFKFAGTGKTVAFDAFDNIITLSSKGIGKYKVNDLEHPYFIANENISNFIISGKGAFYIATGDAVKVYSDWDALASNSTFFIQKFDSRVSSIAVDANDQYMAVGTYNGYIWINGIKAKTVLWNRALHLSSVNDLEFAMVNGGKLQLSSASADQTIKLINVNSVIKKNYTEDIITLKGHSKWIYSLYYTQGGHWLCSAGEDNKVIAWKPTMEDLYKTLTEQ